MCRLRIGFQTAQRLLIAASLGFYLTACGGDGDLSDKLRTVEFVQVDPKGRGSFEGRIGFYVIRSQNDYQALFAYQNSFDASIGAAPVVAPVIDFSQFMIIGVAMKETTCDVVVFRKVQISGIEMVADYLYSRPVGAGCPASTYQPYQFIRVPFTAAPVRFVEVQG